MSTLPALRPICRPMTRSIFDAGKKSAERIISDLFAQGQQGFWLPFTDFASLTQDSAGTLPYTALEQPVGRVLDKSGRGNHATQPTSTARGIVSARVNLLDNSEFAGNSGVSAGANYSFSTLSGYLGAVSFALHPSGGYAYKSGSPAVGLTCVFSVVVKMDDESAPRTASQSATDDFRLVVNGTSYPAVSTVALGGGLYRLTTAPILINSGNIGIVKYSTNSAKPFTATAYSLVPIAQSALPYQRVNTSTDYDSVGFPKYARLDGTDDFYTCGGAGSTTGFYYSDVIKLAAVGTLVALFSNASGGKGYYLSVNPDGSVALGSGNGTTYTILTTTTKLVVGVAVHIEAIDDMTNLTIVINGVAQSIGAPVHNAGPLTAFNLYRGSSPANYFNGKATEPIYRAGPPPSEHERGVIRAYQMQKAGL